MSTCILRGGFVQNRDPKLTLEGSIAVEGHLFSLGTQNSILTSGKGSIFEVCFEESFLRCIYLADVKGFFGSEFFTFDYVFSSERVKNITRKEKKRKKHKCLLF